MSLSVKFTMDLSGDKALVRAFHKLPDAVQRKHLAAAMVKAGQAVRRRARANLRRNRKTPKRGLVQVAAGLGWRKMKKAKGLADALTVSRWSTGVRRRLRAQGIVGVSVGAEKPYGAHSHLVEFGHRKVLWGKRTSGRVPAYPFLRPALEASRGEAESVVRARLAKGIAVEAQRLAKKGR